MVRAMRFPSRTTRPEDGAMNVDPRSNGYIRPGILLGVGLGGFFDGIVLHQILQWHHMLSTPVPATTIENLELNTIGDGVFHAATWIVTLAGVFTLMASNGARHRPGGIQTLIGGMVLGWGAFNLVEGLVDHQLLGLHHVRPGPDELVYDFAFLVWGALMMLAGVALIRSSARTS